MSKTAMERQWATSYIFFEGSVNSFLQQEVYPFIQSLENRELMSKYFFVRYFENGQHVRLRCHAAGTVSGEQLQSVLKEWAISLVSSNVTSDYKILHFETPEYIPELDRYGGSDGIGICEDFFCACSQVVISFLYGNKGVSYEQILAFAFKLHISFIVLLEPDHKKQKTFFDEVNMQWSYRSHYFLESWHGKPGNYTEEAGLLYKQSYISQKDLFDEIALNTIEEVSGVDMDDYMRHWKEAVLTLRKDLYSINGHTDFNSFKYILWSVFHMTNNRLGIINMDESFLGYVLRESIESINCFNNSTNAAN